MSVSCGFYNSLNGDRKYNASQMSAIFDGLITDGIFMSVGNAMTVIAAGANMNIVVSDGRAWFNSTWTVNDAGLVLTVDQSDMILNRIDAVVLEIDATESVRNNTIKIIKGIPASNPINPVMVKTSLINQYPLAYIYVAAGVTSIIQANLTNKVGTSDCPFVTGIMDTMNIDALVAQWQSQFSTWFNNLVDVLDENAEANLLAQINQKAAKSITHTVILPSAGWTGASAPYLNTVNVADVTATNNIFVTVGEGATLAQYTAAVDAQLHCSAQAAGNITMKSMDTKPTTDIPITVLILG